MWVGQTTRGGPYVYTLEGYQPRRISTQSVEQALLRSTDLSAATLWTYQDAGGEFVCLDAPGLDTTWVWDAATRLWHERGELYSGVWTPSRITHAAYRSGVMYATGGTKLYRMSRSYYDLAGDALVRERTFPHIMGAEFRRGRVPVAGASLHDGRGHDAWRYHPRNQQRRRARVALAAGSFAGRYRRADASRAVDAAGHLSCRRLARVQAAVLVCRSADDAGGRCCHEPRHAAVFAHPAHAAG